MNKNLIAVLALATFGSSVFAAPQTFDFKDPKGVNNAVFKLDAPLEAINGSANGVSGTVTFDAANPGATKGKIVVAANSAACAQSHDEGTHAWSAVARCGQERRDHI